MTSSSKTPREINRKVHFIRGSTSCVFFQKALLYSCSIISCVIGGKSGSNNDLLLTASSDTTEHTQSSLVVQNSTQNKVAIPTEVTTLSDPEKTLSWLSSVSTQNDSPETTLTHEALANFVNLHADELMEKLAEHVHSDPLTVEATTRIYNAYSLIAILRNSHLSTKATIGKLKVLRHLLTFATDINPETIKGLQMDEGTTEFLTAVLVPDSQENKDQKLQNPNFNSLAMLVIRILNPNAVHNDQFNAFTELLGTYPKVALSQARTSRKDFWSLVVYSLLFPPNTQDRLLLLLNTTLDVYKTYTHNHPSEELFDRIDTNLSEISNALWHNPPPNTLTNPGR